MLALWAACRNSCCGNLEYCRQKAINTVAHSLTASLWRFAVFRISSFYEAFGNLCRRAPCQKLGTSLFRHRNSCAEKRVSRGWINDNSTKGMRMQHLQVHAVDSARQLPSSPSGVNPTTASLTSLTLLASENCIKMVPIGRRRVQFANTLFEQILGCDCLVNGIANRLSSPLKVCKSRVEHNHWRMRLVRMRLPSRIQFQFVVVQRQIGIPNRDLPIVQVGCRTTEQMPIGLIGMFDDSGSDNLRARYRLKHVRATPEVATVVTCPLPEPWINNCRSADKSALSTRVSSLTSPSTRS